MAPRNQNFNLTFPTQKCKLQNVFHVLVFDADMEYEIRALSPPGLQVPFSMIGKIAFWVAVV